jgi:hypothetical protein
MTDRDRRAARVAEVAESVRELRAKITDWLDRHGIDRSFARFVRHFEVLRAVLGRMTGEIERRLDAVPADSGTAYAECRRLEDCLVVVRRIFGWYADKYDQRPAPVLAAADEVVRSCWTAAFTALGVDPPSAPLAYLDNRFDAYATVRVCPPSDLTGPADLAVAEFVNELPIPTIALPAAAAGRAWWLVVAAHETGHHVLSEVDGMIPALAGVPGWSPWWEEVFADAYAAVTVGPAGAWAVEELTHDVPELLTKPPERTDRYPPTAVRLALCGELAGRPAAAEWSRWLEALPPDAVPPRARSETMRHLRAVPEIARALLDTPLAAIRPPDPARIESWARKLGEPRPLFARLDTADAARTMIAAGVRALERDGYVTDARQRLHSNLVDTLRSCGEPGVLAEAPSRIDLDALAGRLAMRLVTRPPGAQ